MSEDNKSTSTGGGMGITSAIVIVLIILKIIGVEPVVQWSWLSIIFVPYLIGLAIWAAFFLVMFLIALVFSGGHAATTAHGKRSIQKLMDKVDDMDDEA